MCIFAYNDAVTTRGFTRGENPDEDHCWKTRLNLSDDTGKRVRFAKQVAILEALLEGESYCRLINVQPKADRSFSALYSHRLWREIYYYRSVGNEYAKYQTEY